MRKLKTMLCLMCSSPMDLVFSPDCSHTHTYLDKLIVFDTSSGGDPTLNKDTGGSYGLIAKPEENKCVIVSLVS